MRFPFCHVIVVCAVTWEGRRGSSGDENATDTGGKKDNKRGKKKAMKERKQHVCGGMSRVMCELRAGLKILLAGWLVVGRCVHSPPGEWKRFPSQVCP